MSEKVTGRRLPVISICASLCLASLGRIAPAHARNDVGRFSIASALSSQGARAGLGVLPVFYGPTPGPAGATVLGEVVTSKKTNAFGKSDEVACQWAFLTALKTLQSEAAKLGASALVNVHSNYQNNEFISATEFECGAGAIMAGTALRGTAVKTSEAVVAVLVPAPVVVAPKPAPPVVTAPAAVSPHKAADSLDTLAASASENDDLIKARKRFEKGQRFYDLRRYVESVPEFEAAYELSGDAVLLYNLAQAYRMAEKYPDALHYYKAYLKKVPKSPRTEIVKRRISELDATQQPPNNVDDPRPVK